MGLAALLTTGMYGHLWLRVWRPIKNRPAYRVLFSGSTMLLACLTVAPALNLLGVGTTLVGSEPNVYTVAGVVLGIAAFTTVNSVLIMVGLKLHSPDRAFLPLVGSWADNALELATLCLVRRQPPQDHQVVTQEIGEAAAAVMVEGERAVANLAVLHGRLRPWFARAEPFGQARKYMTGLMSDLPRKSGWTVAEHAGGGAG